MLNVLITGANSYIGENFREYAHTHYKDELSIESIDMVDRTWREKDFSSYDVVYHVAGIAHTDVGSVNEEIKKKYYAVNTDLAIETAKKAKKDGVKQFVFMSSAIIYGDSAPIGKRKRITKKTKPHPANFYGDSKWRADKGVRKLADENFKVTVLRPPMIYGKGSKGNYPTLSKMAKKLPIFPDIKNERSMLYIENLCEFLCQVMIRGKGGIFWPQNAEYSKTSDLVKMIANANHHKIFISKVWNVGVKLATLIPGKPRGLANKAFGNMSYDQKMSAYDFEYQGVGLRESVERTEEKKETQRSNKKKHILVVSQYFYPENFRINDMASEWVKRGYRVTVLTGIPNYPQGEYFDGYDLKHRRRENWNGVDIIRLPIKPRKTGSINLIKNYLSFVIQGKKWVRTSKLKTDLVYTFEVSPMTQALVSVWYAKKNRIPHILYVTDLWPENVEIITGIHNKFAIYPIQKMVDYIYKRSNRILTCSNSFIDPIKKRRVSSERIDFWPQYAEDFYKPVERVSSSEIPDDGVLNLVFAGNVGFAQGLGILPKAAARLKKDNVKVRFNVVGDGRYMPCLSDEIKELGVESYFNFIERKSPEKIPAYLAAADALLITLSKSEVFSITIPAKTQSCMACGRPILVSADGEVSEIIKESKSGLVSQAEDVDEFVSNIKSLNNMPKSERERFGKNALAYSKKYFDKNTLLDRLDDLFEKENQYVKL